MYPNRGGPGPDQQAQRQWEQPPQHHPGYLPSGHPVQHQHQPPLNGGFAPVQAPLQQAPQIRPDRPEMATLHPQQYHQDPNLYRLPAPANFYPPPQDPYRNPQASVPNMNQSAPRQRTAIACKYCRRRKIRCSGFESSEDGRCSNCVRFSQECIFTPVSAQTQAFVPAQAVYGRGARNSANAPQLYGAYGQRLPNQHDPYANPNPQQPYTLPSPTGAYPGHPGQPYAHHPYPPQPYDPNVPPPAGRRRIRDEPHTPTLAPPNPAEASHLAVHSQPNPAAYAYPDPVAYANGPVSPASSTASYATHQVQPYYAPQPARRMSPNSLYSYEASRDSASPAQPGPYAYAAGQPSLQQQQQQQPAPPEAAMLKTEGRTPPPPSATSDHGANRNGINIKDIVSEAHNNGQGKRSTTDNDMVSALNRTTRR